MALDALDATRIVSLFAMNRAISLYSRPRFIFSLRRNRRFAAAAIAFLEQFPLDSAVELVV